MSRVDLDQIQAQLKVAIQSHQILVAKMKNDPQNTGLQKQLHELQSEITSLSQRQKSIVQLLRKELVHKQAGHATLQTQVLSPAPAHQAAHPVVSRVSLPPPQTMPTNLSTKGPHSYNSLNNNNNKTTITPSLTPAPKPAHTNSNHTHNGQTPHVSQQLQQQQQQQPQPQLLQPVLQQYRHATPQPQSQPQTQPQPQPQNQSQPAGQASHGPRPMAVAHLGAVKAQDTQTVAATGRTNSPPIRVPQYHRPSIIPLTGRRTAMMRTTTGTHTGAIPHVRKHSDYEITDVKRATIDRKQLTPEERKKEEYMASLDLVTHDTLKELQSKRSERKRRSTANPQFSYGHFEPERKRNVVHYLTNMAPMQGPRKRGRPPKRRPPPVVLPVYYEAEVPGPSQVTQNGTPTTEVDGVEGDAHEDFCAICQRSGELLMCDTCNLVYHLNCLEPPLTTIPQGLWSCPKCTALNKNANWPGTLALVHSYIAQKAAKEEEKRKLQKRSQELNQEKSALEDKAKQLKEAISEQLKHQTHLISANKNAQLSVDRLKTFIKFFQTS